MEFVLEQLLFEESSIPYNIKESMCFYDDALTGGHTVAIKIDDISGRMADLQGKVVAGLRAFIDFSAAPNLVVFYCQTLFIHLTKNLHRLLSGHTGYLI